jgi:phage shock protein PspC (stress-responsive transcriptional regulator)
LTLKITLSTDSERAIRVVSALIFAIGAAIVLYLLQRGYLAEWLIRWPYAFGVAAGLAWWLWLSPSVIGLAIVAVCVLGSLRRSWPGADVNQ